MTIPNVVYHLHTITFLQALFQRRSGKVLVQASCLVDNTMQAYLQCGQAGAAFRLTTCTLVSACMRGGDLTLHKDGACE